MEKEQQALLLNTCLTAGRIMAEAGSEAYRVEDTMQRIAQNAGEATSVSYVTATGLFMSLRASNLTQIDYVRHRSINLEKVVAVNQLSRQFATKAITLEQLSRELAEVDREIPTFPIHWRILAAGFVSSTLMIAFGGSFGDFLPTFVIGALGYMIAGYGLILLEIRFLSELAAAFLIGCLTYLAVNVGLATNLDSIIIGSVMPLVPGVAITTSFRDLLAGHLVSGMARGVEAAFTAGAIAVGIALAIRLFALGG